MAEIDLTPITRLEYDIDAILNDHAVAEPITRIELILADIVAGNTTTVEPVTRIETYLAIISGADYPVPEPVTRIETFLAIIAGEDYEEPEAVTRLEGLLAEWVEKGSGIWKTVTGTLIHITNALASPMQKCEITLEPIQEGTGDPSPTNVRPITGWTGCEVNRTGVNVWDEEVEIGSLNTISGEDIASSAIIRTKNYVPVIGGSRYYFVTTDSPNGVWMMFYDRSKTIITDGLPATSVANNARKIGNGIPLTMPSECAYVRWYFQSAYGTTYNNDTSLNYPSTDTDYHAYSGATLSVTFPDSTGTVYGGTVDLVSGVLTVNKIYRHLKDFTWSSNNAGLIGWEYYSNTSVTGKKKGATNIISDQFKTVSAYSNVAQYTIRGFANADYIAINFPAELVPSSAEVTKWLTEHDAVACYELAEPTEISLTPQEISTLAGENNVWSNSNGDTTIIYKAQAE